jgi:hypothetical protein
MLILGETSSKLSGSLNLFPPPGTARLPGDDDDRNSLTWNMENNDNSIAIIHG